ncbi:hypothetical protein [Brucella sp. 10RB9213]|uniref:hypothetical protein n=1 Tax=Brucella sp. 10RB9213 TaxID=1844039 RepID=UPI00189E8CB7|nr:hypothetical protein [Brucella sp. 10RB9213]
MESITIGKHTISFHPGQKFQIQIRYHREEVRQFSLARIADKSKNIHALLSQSTHNQVVWLTHENIQLEKLFRNPKWALTAFT